MREKITNKLTDLKQVFAIRGVGSTRLEQLSDGVIALAITLLLVSLQAPKTAAELLLFAKDFLAFALSTVVLIAVWYKHYLYFLIRLTRQNYSAY